MCQLPKTKHDNIKHLPKSMAKKHYKKKLEKCLITAAQDQGMSTKYHQTQILGINQDSKCCMSKETNEAVFHILNMCPKLTTNNYFKRHNDVAAIFNRNMSALWDSDK